jgi:hypothetical protein
LESLPPKTHGSTGRAPSGFSLQISWVTSDKRLVGANADKPMALRKYP